MSVRRLPVRLDLEQLQRQAKELLRAIHAGDANAIAELREHHPESIDPSAATTRCLSRSKEKSVGIPHTYHDGSPEDRAHVRDFWTWLEQQPQHAWLYYARNAKTCSSTWSATQSATARSRAGCFGQAIRPTSSSSASAPTGTLLGAILDRSENVGFDNAGLCYRRVEVALQALRAAEVLTSFDGPPPFRIPRDLCASFEGRNPDLPPFDDTTERDLEEMFQYLDGTLPRTDRESWKSNERGGNWWYERALQLPSTPAVTAHMSDVEAIDAVFGEHRSTLARVEHARANRNANVRRAGVGSAEQSAGARWGLNPDPKQRVIGLVLLIVSVLALVLLLVARIAR
jgi:hypothetical protein